jgi:hypothetical protein
MARNPIIRESIPEVRAGAEETPHGCYRGLVFIGHMIEDDSGVEAEVIEAVPCQRCSGDVSR